MITENEERLDSMASELCEYIDQITDDIIVRNELKIKVLRFSSTAIGMMKENMVVSPGRTETGIGEPMDTIEVTSLHTANPSLDRLAKDFMEDME